MTKRRAITAKMKIASLLYHNDIDCALCGQWLTSVDQIEWDHFIPLAMGGAHNDTNIRAVHAKCHRLKTFGAGATTAGADIGKIAKDKRIRAGKMDVKKFNPQAELNRIRNERAAMDKKKRRPWPKVTLRSKGFVKI